MKKIFNLFINPVACIFALVMISSVAYGQCPMGQSEVTVTYNSGAFDNETSWMLYDATAGAEVFCFTPTPAPGPVSACVADGNVLELYAWDNFGIDGDTWNGASLTAQQTEEVVTCDATTQVVVMTFLENVEPLTNDASGENAVCGVAPTAAGQLVPGVLVGSFALGSSTCEIVCPDNIQATNDPGQCGAVVELPAPGFDPEDCNLITETGIVDIDDTTTGSFATLDPSGGNVVVGMYPVSIPTGGLCGVAVPPCHMEGGINQVCIDVTVGGDMGGDGFEQVIFTSTDFPTFTFDTDPDQTGDCQTFVLTFCLTPAMWDAVNANCSLDFNVNVVGNGVDADLCAFNGISAAMSMGSDCDDFDTTIMLPDGSTVSELEAGLFPVGCSVVTYTATGGTGSGTGSGTVFGEPGFPISCDYEVLVLDTEAPVMSCPRDFTYNLQSGECCEVYNYEVTATDNCPSSVQTAVSACGDPCEAPTGVSSLACGVGPNHLISLISAGGEGDEVVEVCYNQTGFGLGNAATINLYCYDGVDIPFDDGNATFVPFATTSFTPAAADNGACVCVELSGGFVPADCTTVAIEFVSSARLLETPATCGGGAATGEETFIVAPACGLNTPGTFGSIGFALDAGYTIGFLPPAIEPVMATPPAGLFGADATVNAFESGAALPTGTHCFYFEATDNAGGVVDCCGEVVGTTNMSSCSWCVVVNDVPNVTSALTCDDHVNVSVDENCQVVITADMFLEGGPYSCLFDCYEVYIKDEHNHPIAATCFNKLKPEVDASDVSAFDVNGCTIGLECGTYTYEVYDACRDNTCWGTFTVEDKLAPSIVDPADVTLNCTQSTAPGETCLGTSQAAVEGCAVSGLVWADGTTGPVANASFIVPPAQPGAIITDISIDVQMSHSWMGDIEMILTGPDGTSIFLVDNQCGANDNMDVTFSDSAANGITCTAGAGPANHEECNQSFVTFATIGGEVQTNDFTNGGAGLTQWVGQAVAGTWTLDINDTVGGDGGSLEGFSINIDWAVPAAPAATLATGVTFVDADGNPVDEDDAGAIAVGCDDDITFVDDFFDGGCDGSFIIRTWVATDAKGNQSTTTQRIDIIQIGADKVGTDWFWPRDVVELNCGVDYSPEGIYEFFKARFQANTPCPDPKSCDDPSDPYVKACVTAGTIWAYPNIIVDKDGNRASFIENNCEMIFDYSDQLLGACGVDCPGNSKVIRTWTGLDWCTAETVSATQVIHAKDTEGPVVDMDSAAGVQSSTSITVGYNPWGCTAEFALPAPEHLTDNCSTVIDYTVSGPATVTYVPLEGGNGYWSVSGAPKGDHVFTYTATDCCGNEGTGFVLVTVVDNSPPVASAIQNIVVGLTFSPTNPEAGSAKVYVDMIDNGSHDGTCGIVKTAIRRVDGGSCGNDGLVINGTTGERHDNNSTFFAFRDDSGNILSDNDQPAEHDKDDTDEGQFVKFCCDDLFSDAGVDVDGDGVNDYVDIMVELGVWDDANCNGWPGTPGDRFSKTWSTVRLEAKVAPVLACPPNAMITCDQDENSDLIINTILGRATASSACGSTDVKFTDVCDWEDDSNDFTSADRNSPDWEWIRNCSEIGPNGETIVNDADGDGICDRFDDETFTMMGITGSETFNKACHYGPIVRTWSIPGTSMECKQIIIVKEPTNFFSGSYYKLDANGNYLLNGNNPISNALDNAGSITWPYGTGWPNNMGGDEAVDVDDDNFDDYAEVALDCVDALQDVEPMWTDAHCSLIGWSLDSDTLNFEGDACKKIINKYCVIDWCQYDPNGAPSRPNNGDMRGNNEAPGKWCWTVIGKLLDPYAPSIIANDDMFPASAGAGGSGGFATTTNCVGTASMSATATDTSIDADGNEIDNACPSEWIKWVVLVDINNDWTYDYEYSSFVNPDDPNAVPYFTDTNGNGIPDVQVGESEFDNIDTAATSPGEEYTINIPATIAADCGETQHRVEWTAYDGCGNTTSTTSYFTVQDKKAPTPYCVNLSTALMDIPVGGGEAMVELWAIDFDAGSFDNCTADESLLFTFTDDPSTVIPEFRSAAMTFNCDDLAGGNPALLTLPVYVWDACGNRDFCQVNLRLTDNNGACPTGTTTGSAIAGTVMTEAGQTVENVDVMNAQMPTSMELHRMTSDAGYYNFAKNDLTMDYQVTGTKNDDYLNGVSTIDLVMIQRHILGINKFDSAYKMIAADINNDNVIDGRDLVELRKLILGIYSELPQNNSWRFGDANQTLDITNPWNFDETIDIAQLSADMMDENFIGVKIGDVNGDVVANINTPSTSSTSSNVINVEFEDVTVEAGQTVEVTVNANLNDVFGYQFTLATPGLQLVNVEAVSINVTEANFGVFGDVVTTSWNDTKGANVSDKLFTMTFKSTVAGQLSEILDLNSNVTKAEAYVGSNLDIVNIGLENTTATAEFALNQNEPNPFSSTTVIGFEMAETADATMTVYDVTGKIISVVNGNYAKGYNEITLSKSDLGASGVLYYQFDSGEFTATKKMIIIE